MLGNPSIAMINRGRTRCEKPLLTQEFPLSPWPDGLIIDPTTHESNIFGDMGVLYFGNVSLSSPGNTFDVGVYEYPVDLGTSTVLAPTLHHIEVPVFDLTGLTVSNLSPFIVRSFPPIHVGPGEQDYLLLFSLTLSDSFGYFFYAYRRDPVAKLLENVMPPSQQYMKNGRIEFYTESGGPSNGEDPPSPSGFQTQRITVNPVARTLTAEAPVSGSISSALTGEVTIAGETGPVTYRYHRDYRDGTLGLHGNDGLGLFDVRTTLFRDLFQGWSSDLVLKKFANGPFIIDDAQVGHESSVEALRGGLSDGDRGWKPSKWLVRKGGNAPFPSWSPGGSFANAITAHVFPEGVMISALPVSSPALVGPFSFFEAVNGNTIRVEYSSTVTVFVTGPDLVERSAETVSFRKRVTIHTEAGTGNMQNPKASRTLGDPTKVWVTSLWEPTFGVRTPIAFLYDLET